MARRVMKERARVLPLSLIPRYLKYVIPTMVTFTLTGIYSIVDGIFVGHAVGDAGLAGINVAYPLVCLVFALGTGIGMGGGVISSIRRGRGEEEAAQKVVGTTLVMLLAVSIPVAIAYNLAAEPACRALGGQGETLHQAVRYLEVIALGVPFQLVTTGCLPLIRNKGEVAYAMFVQVIAGVVNVVLDWLFIMEFAWGVAGGALATVIAQVAAAVGVAGFFARRANRIPLRALAPSPDFAAHICKLGLAPFGLTMLPEVSTVVNNVSLSHYGGETALAAYAAIAYVAFFVQAMIQSVGDGSQPLISVYRGAGDADTVRRLRNTNYVVAIAFGAVGLALMYLLRNVIPQLFGASTAAAEVIAFALPVFSICYVFYGFTHTTTSYFYATDDARASNILVISEAVIVCVAVYCLSAAFGVNGVWFSPTVLQLCLCVIAVVLLRRRHAGTSSEGKVHHEYEC